MPRPPLTVSGWLKALGEGRQLGFVAGGAAAYYAYGFYSAFGGRILDREGTCVADQGGVAQALAWIRQAADAGLVFFPDGGAAAAALAAGDIDGYIEGNWRFGDLRSAVGDDLGVVPGPSGPGGLFRPLTGVDGIVVNAASPHSKAALVSALALTTRENQRRWMQIAGHVPADRSIVIDDPRVAVYAAVTAFGVPRPQVPEFDNYWGPFTDAFNAVVFGGADAAVAVANACAAMNELNGH